MPNHPWDRRKAETTKSYEAFLTYCKLGPRRSLEKVCEWVAATVDAEQAARGKTPRARPPRAQNGTVKKWCRANDRVARATAWDEYRRGLVQAAEEKEWVEWQRKVRKAASAAYEDGDKLREMARRMAGFPLRRRKRASDNTIIEPARWTMRDVARFMEAAAMLQGAATAAISADPPPNFDPDNPDNYPGKLQGADLPAPQGTPDATPDDGAPV